MGELTPDELVQLRDDLIRARAKGRRMVRGANGETVQYGTDAEMAAALADLTRRIAQARHPRITGTLTITTRKGA